MINNVQLVQKVKKTQILRNKRRKTYKKHKMELKILSMADFSGGGSATESSPVGKA